MGGLATRSRLTVVVAIVALFGGLVRSAAAAPRIEVVVGLAPPSLVQFAHARRSLQGYGHARRVLASAFGSRLYLSQLAGEQAAATARIEREVPGARVRRHYRTVLDGVSVLVRPDQLAALRHVAGVTAVYPNLRYHALTDSVPEVVGAPAVWGPELTGSGAGVKVGVIDDGIDVHHPYFAARGLKAPPGFPRGNRAYTSGKVIVARSFAPAGAPRRDRLPFEAGVSRHGTHVAGILAGDNGVTAPGEIGRPAVRGLSGVAPMAWLGNYRGLSQPDPVYGSVGSTADLVAAVDAAASDGMDVINLSIGGTEIDPRADALVLAVQGAIASGVVVVVAAGNERESLGYGSIDSPGAATSAITVAATSSAGFFARASTITGSRPVPALLHAFGVAAPDVGEKPHRTSGRVVRAVGANARLCRRYAGDGLRIAIAVVPRGGCSVIRKAHFAFAAGATGLLVAPPDAGPPAGEFDSTSVPVLVAPAPVVAALRSYLAGGATARLTLHAVTHEEPAVPGVVATFSSAGPTPFDHLLKPDIAAPGVAILSSVPNARKGEAGDWAVFDGTSMATPVVAGAAALLVQAHPDWTPADVKGALMATARPAFADEAGTREASPLAAGAGLVDVAAAVDPGIVADPPSVDFGDVADGVSLVVPLELSDLGSGVGDWSLSARIVGSAPQGISVSVPPVVSIPAGGSATVAVQATIAPHAREHDAAGVIELVQGSRTRRVPFWVQVDRPGLATKPFHVLRAGQTFAGDTRGAGNRASIYRYPADASSFGLPNRFDGPEQLFRFHVGQGAANAGVTVTTSRGVTAYPILLRSRDENSVAGESGLPLNVGPLPSESSIVPAAGLDFPPAGDYWVAVESPRGHAGRYRISLWVNDVRPPLVRVIGQTMLYGRRVLRVSIVDAGSGVNPEGVVVSGGGVSHRSLDFDARTGIATIDLQRLRRGEHTIRIVAPDLAETKDVLSATARKSNTTTRVIRLTIP
ncbi:MAG: S8 family serine peptidase [Gaiellales bacterium]